MIYVYPDASAPIRQGDIFRHLPRTQILLGDENLPIVFEATDEGMRQREWTDIARSQDEILSSTFIRSVTGIVITQDCDAVWTESIALCQILPFADVERSWQGKTSPSRFVKTVTRQARINQKWYYLPPDDQMGFDRMAADFTSVFEVPREMLEEHRSTLRLGRLEDGVASPHFRERIAEFFRRYPYNEWYPLTPTEVDIYEKSKSLTVERYPWQNR